MLTDIQKVSLINMIIHMKLEFEWNVKTWRKPSICSWNWDGTYCEVFFLCWKYLLILISVYVLVSICSSIFWWNEKTGFRIERGLKMEKWRVKKEGKREEEARRTENVFNWCGEFVPGGIFINQWTCHLGQMETSRWYL